MAMDFRMFALRVSCMILGSFAASAQTAPPSIFFSDLVTGPKTGGRAGNGAIVTIWGKNFGATRGTSTISIGGGNAAYYGPSDAWWSDTKISFELGASAASGNIVVATGAGSSNGMPFTIQTGSVYFVAQSGSDSAAGTFAAPWATIVHAKNTMAAGSVAYVRTGTYSTTEDNYNAGLVLSSTGTSAAWYAIAAYPTETAIIGQTAGARPTYGIRTVGAKYWVVSQFKVLGIGEALESGAGTDNVRYIGNDFSDPAGSGQAACTHFDSNTNIFFYGNYVHDVGTLAGSIDKYYHAVYFTTNSNHIWVGWNTIVPNTTHSTTSGGCRALQFYSTGGSDQYDLHVHDNLIHDAICDGINFATVNADAGPVEAYNNVVYHVGTGPDPTNGSSNYACYNIGSSASRTNAVELYNNTSYDCGSRLLTDSGAYTLSIKTRLRNNLTYQTGSEFYLGPNTGAGSLSGSNNLWFGRGTGPTQTSTSVNSDPQIANLSAFDFRISSTSPAKDAGVAISGLTMDINGVNRPQGSAYDIGATEYFQGSTSSQPTCNITVTSAINQALGVEACSSANLANDGCTVVDVQRVINYQMAPTGGCRVGQ